MYLNAYNIILNNSTIYFLTLFTQNTHFHKLNLAGSKIYRPKFKVPYKSLNK